MKENNIPFKTLLNRGTSEAAPTGDGFVNEYAWTMVDGDKVLRKSGRRNLYEEIQTHTEDNDLRKLIMELDPNAIPTEIEWDGKLFDESNLPTDIYEAQQMVHEAEDLFSTLPLEMRKEFNFSAEKFINMAGTGEFNDIISRFIPQETFPEPENKPEIKIEKEVEPIVNK